MPGRPPVCAALVLARVKSAQRSLLLPQGASWRVPYIPVLSPLHVPPPHVLLDQMLYPRATRPSKAPTHPSPHTPQSRASASSRASSVWR